LSVNKKQTTTTNRFHSLKLENVKINFTIALVCE
jgi:hypothetical protein